MVDFASAGRYHFLAWLRQRIDQDLPRTPKVLWHYTDAGGLKGIVESQLLWATDTRFLNDAAEFRYGLDLVMRTLQEVDLTSAKPATQRFVLGLVDDHAGSMRPWMEKSVSLFVACFCQDGDLLSQWRAYAGFSGGAGGYALGYETKSPQAWVQSAPGGHELSLRRVIYDFTEQAQACESLIRPLVTLLDMEPSNVEAQRAFARNLVDGAVEVAAWCKHPAFEEEREWRIVYQRTTDSAPLGLRFRPKMGFLVPYVELALPEPTGVGAGIMPVRHINHGPSSDPRSREGVRMFLESQSHYSEVEVMGSLAPLRL